MIQETEMTITVGMTGAFTARKLSGRGKVRCVRQEVNGPWLDVEYTVGRGANAKVMETSVRPSNFTPDRRQRR